MPDIYDARITIAGVELDAQVQFAETAAFPADLIVNCSPGPRALAKITAFAVNEEAERMRSAMGLAQGASVHGGELIYDPRSDA